MIRTLLLLSALSHPAFAETLSQADVVQGQLRAGWQTQSGNHMSALHLRLAPEWKTYWRAPGDAGIPPVFDWSGSTNLKAVRFHWPSPEIFHTNGLQTIGYHHELVLPIEIEAIDPAKPVRLLAEVDLGVCKDICVPASLSLSTELLPPGQPDRVIVSALKAAPATAAAAGLGRISCQVEPIRDGLRVTAEMTLPSQGREEAVVMETGLSDVWASEAVVNRVGKELTAVVDLVPPSGAPFALVRDKMTITVIGDRGRAVEIRGCPSS